MAKQAAVRAVDLEPIDRLEEKIKLLVAMVTRLRAEQAKAADDNARLAQEIRMAGCSVELGLDAKVKRSMELANKIGARFVLLVGDNEMAAGRYALKNMSTGEQEQLTRDEIADRLVARN